MLKLLHLGDLHLDSPFSKLSYNESVSRRAAIRETFNKAIKFVIEKEIDIVLLTGDLFDSEFYSENTISFLVKEFNMAPKCKFIISPGNHDPYTLSSPYRTKEFPSNVFIFKSEEMASFEFTDLNLTIYGYAFTSHSYNSYPLKNFHTDNKGINILCAHGDTDSKELKYAPIRECDLISSGLDYVALGHIHTNMDIRKAGETIYAYSGCLCGRDAGEFGEHGGLFVSIDIDNLGNKVVKTERVTFCSWVFDTINCDITNLEFSKDIADKINSTLDNSSSLEHISKIKLYGSVSTTPDIKELMTLVNGNVYEIEDHTALVLEELEKDYSIKGEVYRALKPRIFSDDPETRNVAVLALKYALTALNRDTPNLE